ncbi:hypothetical protein AYX13_05107 [Cryptococcus neoformans]|nr:hypothetical protein AYX13_05107 [Cryptococcus neoformans var. grubii]
MALFPSTRSLIFPQFETYRLRSLDPSSDLSFSPLPQPGATQSRMEYNQQHLSFKEVRSRISWDHLSVSGRRGVYIDKVWGVVGFVIQDDFTPTFVKLADLPEPISISEQQSEFPSVLPLSPTHWAISTGNGSIYILQSSSPESENFTGEIIARYDLQVDGQNGGEPAPFLLRAQHDLSDVDVRLLLTRSRHPNQGKVGYKSVQSTQFELLEISLNPSVRNGVDSQPAKLVIKWALQGKDLPVWCAWQEDGWLVLGEEEFREKVDESGQEETEEEKSKRERDEKIARLGLGVSLTADESAVANDKKDESMEVDEARGNPYFWTQDVESLSLTIPVPDSVSRAVINIGFTSTSFSFTLSQTPSDLSSQLMELLSKPTRQLWASIDVDVSTWTFDSSKHIIEVDLKKIDENTRWPSIFFPAEDDEDAYEEVPETLSASTLAAVRETFNNIKTRGPDEPEMMHPAMPALLREEMDFDLDDGEDFGEGGGVYGELGGGSKVGRDVLVGYVEVGSGKASWSKATNSVLSVPINGSDDNSIIVKQAVDGLVFRPTTDLSKKPWTHIFTNPALAFVISSKQDLRFVRHLITSPISRADPTSPSVFKKAKVDPEPVQSTVLAFDSGSSSSGQGNVYIYYPPTSKTNAQQGVLSISGGDRGALLGVGCVKVDGKDVVVALCENELIVLKGVL